MLSVDYSCKRLNVSVTEEDRQTLRGIVYNPRTVFGDINTCAALYHDEHFASATSHETLSFQTEGGPGEIAGRLRTEFDADHSMHIGGMIAMFTIKKADFKRVKNKLADNPEFFSVSEEKKEYGDTFGVKAAKTKDRSNNKTIARWQGE